MDTFDFQEALSYIKCGETVELTLNGISRKYYLENNVIMCIPNNKSTLTYRVKEFKIDAILSTDWKLCS